MDDVINDMSNPMIDIDSLKECRGPNMAVRLVNTPNIAINFANLINRYNTLVREGYNIEDIKAFLNSITLSGQQVESAINSVLLRTKKLIPGKQIARTMIGNAGVLADIDNNRRAAAIPR